MRIERTYTDGNGQSFRAVIEIDDAGPALERALLRLSNKARRSGAGRVAALDGAVRVTLEEVK